MGSKARHAKEILPIILADREEGQWYVEPFVGGANVIDKVDGNRLGSDINPYVISIYNSLNNGWEPPKEISEDTYKQIKKNVLAAPGGYSGANDRPELGQPSIDNSASAIWYCVL